MRIYSWNVNGIRSVIQKGFLPWLEKSNADFVCVQELKAQERDIPKEISHHHLYHFFGSYAEKKGYSGVGIFAKEKPLSVKTHIGFPQFDSEGRIVELTYKDFVLIGTYIPNGSRDKKNLEYKLALYDSLIAYLSQIKKPIILLGDFNIAHEEIDLARPKENKDNIMFTPEEREKISKLIHAGFVDTYRVFHKSGGVYSWWSYIGHARTKNIGWRIDYVFISKKLLLNLRGAFIEDHTYGSDHCPVGIDIDV
jgi:exodeoxyribonuclease-3